MTFDPSRYLDLFVLETREHLSAARSLLASVEDLRGNDPRVHAFFRHLHSVKGMSACMGFEAMVETADAGENVLAAARAGGRRLGTRRGAVLRDVLDTLGRLLDEARIGVTPIPGGDTVVDPRFRMEEVRNRTLDLTLDLRGDLPLPGARVEMLLGRLRRVGRIVSCDPPETELREALPDRPIRLRLATRRSAARLARDLGRLDDLERFGVVPSSSFASLAERAEASAMDAARRLGRSVRVRTVGADVEVGPELSRALWEPLIHLVRNAVDHGIEPSEVRRSRGKPPEGLVTLRARRTNGGLCISVEDDGAGIDPAARPGLRSRKRVSPVSGRGVGLDAATRSLERLGGRLTLRSFPGRGTTVRLEVPRAVRSGDAR